jgi:predicted nucleic acid-binding protein
MFPVVPVAGAAQQYVRWHRTMAGFMFDTNVFNRILDGKIDVGRFPSSEPYFVTHIQRNEIENTRNPERREALLNTFHGVGHTQVPTESAYFGVSEWGAAKWSAEDGVIEAIIEKLNNKNNGKKNNGLDALIAETAIKNDHTLVTEDRDLREVVLEMGGGAISFQEFQSK